MKRRWHQLHRFTVIAVAILAVGLIVANSVERSWTHDFQPGVIWTGRGWPGPFTRRCHFQNPDEWVEQQNEYAARSGQRYFVSNRTDTLFIMDRHTDEGQEASVFLLFNFAVAVLMLSVATVLIEILIRYREARKTWRR